LQEIKKGASGTFGRYPLLEQYLRVSICFLAPIIIVLVFLDAIGIFRY